MKCKIFISILALSSIVLANSNPVPIEENIDLQQQMQTKDSSVVQPTQNSPIQNQPIPTQPMQNLQMQNMPHPNSAGSNHNVPLQTILDKVHQMYPGAFITDVDYKGFGYEIEINDNLELFFDMNGHLLGQKWD